MIKFLDWDTEFFGMKIGKVMKPKCYNNTIINNILKEGKNENYKCIYLEISFDENTKIIIPSNFHLVDIKVTLNRKIDHTFANAFENITTEIKDEYFPYLENIATEISKKSRYAADSNFGTGISKKLYKKWIYNSIYENYCNKIFIYQHKELSYGFLTLKIKKNIPYIDLIGIKEELKGKNAAKELIIAASNYCFDNGYNEIRVITQGNNIEAMRFYEKNGFRLLEMSIFYHIWL